MSEQQKSSETGLGLGGVLGLGGSGGEPVNVQTGNGDENEQQSKQTDGMTDLAKSALSAAGMKERSTWYDPSTWGSDDED